jgi:hypothetical protein
LVTRDADRYFSNFFVSNVSWWLLEPRVSDFLNAVDDSRGIYRHRWGDAPLSTAALDLYATEAQVQPLGVRYMHLSTRDQVNEDGSVTELAGITTDQNERSFLLTNALYDIRRRLARKLLLTGQGNAASSDSASGGDPASGGDTASGGMGSSDIGSGSGEIRMIRLLDEMALSQLNCNATNLTGTALSLDLNNATNSSLCGLAAQPPSAPPSAPPSLPLMSPPPRDPLRANDFQVPSQASKVATALPVTIAAFGVIGIVGLALVISMIMDRNGSSNAGAESRLVPEEFLKARMAEWGAFVSGRGRGVSILVMLTFLIFGAAGSRLMQFDEGSATEWAPMGGRLEQQVKQVNDWVQVTSDYTHVYMAFGADNNENLLDDPEKWLTLLNRAVRTMRDNAKVTFVGAEYGWDDVCGSLDHPLVNQIAGTGEKPCINPSPLDAFYESTWQFEHLIPPACCCFPPLGCSVAAMRPG